MVRPNIQQAREALGSHLRQLRRETGLNGKEFARALGWPPSKVSKLELGQQTPSPGDLDDWVRVASKPDAAQALSDELTALESFYTEYRRRLRAGMRSRQQEALDTEDKAHRFRVFNTHYVPGLFQTAEYARHMLTKGARHHGAVNDVDEAVAVRMQRQAVLYRPGKTFHFVISEAVLRSQAAAPRTVIAGQLDRLIAGTALGSHVKLGVIPFYQQWPVFLDHGFWLIDDSFVIVETIAAELRLTHPDEIEIYARVFKQLAGIALYGAPAREIMTKALLDLSGDST